MRETSTILREINARVEARRCAAEAGGARLLPPLLMLGTMERVGSNWLSDTLRVAMDQHNEPLRQQLAHDHPLSPLNPDAAGLVAAERRLTPYSRHCLVTFTVSKYATTRQVIKETNLFFAVPNVLELFPDAPVVVLTRSPLGVASSFARGRLFERWDYRARYRQMVDAARRPDAPVAGAAALVPDDDPDDLVALARLHVLNTVLLAAALGTRSDDAGDATGSEIVCIPYESAVRSPAAGWHSLARVLPDLAGTARPAAAQPATPPTAARAGAAQAVAEDTFVTTVPKTALTTHLDERSAELVRAAAAAALDTAQREFPADVAAQAVEWLAGDHLYTPAPPARPSTGRRPLAAAARRGRSALRPGYVTREGLGWRNLLVSNAEFARFLNELADHGVDNRSGGAYLLCCEMPHERGGRLHQTDDGRWTVSPGFEDHPAYWVTWIGAAAFAARHGARLPLLDEMVALMAGGVAPDVAANTDYAVGDTVPVVQDGVAGDAIHHVIGNVQVWCSDGPGSKDEPMARWLTGAAWNTPSAWQEVLRRRARHLAGSSRGVGVRLVQNEPRQPVPADELTALLREWMSGLQERSLPLHVLDGRLTAALAAASQADVGLGAHVGASFGPSGLGQLDETGAEAERGQVGERHELHAADRGGVGPLGDGAHGAAGAGGLERHVDDVGAAAGQVVAHVQQPVDSHFDTGLLTHLAGEGVGEAFPQLDLPAWKRPGAAGVGVLVKQQDLVVFDDDAGDSHFHHARTVPHPVPPGTAIGQAQVVVAAGGLGTRVHRWARYLPKEWLPLDDGRPGIVHILQEVAALGPAHAVIVYHPYYTSFASWARQALAPDGHLRYLRSAGCDLPCDSPGRPLALDWVAQSGSYGDLTSVLNAADHLPHGHSVVDGLYVMFGDNVYPTFNPLAALRQAPPGVAVLARPYQRALAQQRGVLATTPGADGAPVMVDLVEKPNPETARALEELYGPDRLMMLEGRARVDDDFVDYARAHTGGEPKLSLALVGYARTSPVHVVRTTDRVIDLGAPAAWNR